jgi:cytochrome b6-f complex iron-sulfur subunit
VAGVVVGCSNDQGDTSPDAPEVVVSAAEVPAIDAAPYRSATGNFYLVHNSDGVLAFSWSCTHQGCEVPWKENEGRFHCPCHGSIYDRNGIRTDGPAKRPLDLLELTVNERGDITVQTENKTKRSDYEPEQAVPYTTSG